MKRCVWLFVFVITVLCISLTGCNSNRAPEQNTQAVSTSIVESLSHDDVAVIEKRDKLLAGLVRFESDVQATITKSPSNVYNLGVVIKGANYITDFGEIVIITKDIFESEFPDEDRGSMIVSLVDDSDRNLVGFSTDATKAPDSSNYGILMDFRSGIRRNFQLEDENDLIAVFPASRQYVSKSSFDERNVEIYDEVWAALDAQPNRPEEDIFEELAPRYDMTAEQLKALILDMMSQMYQ